MIPVFARSRTVQSVVSQHNWTPMAWYSLRVTAGSANECFKPKAISHLFCQVGFFRKALQRLSMDHGPTKSNRACRLRAIPDAEVSTQLWIATGSC